MLRQCKCLNKVLLLTSLFFVSGHDDVVSNYFSRKGKKYGLLSLFKYAQETLLPYQNKKSFWILVKVKNRQHKPFNLSVYCRPVNHHVNGLITVHIDTYIWEHYYHLFLYFLLLSISIYVCHILSALRPIILY